MCQEVTFSLFWSISKNVGLPVTNLGSSQKGQLPYNGKSISTKFDVISLPKCAHPKDQIHTPKIPNTHPKNTKYTPWNRKYTPQNANHNSQVPYNKKSISAKFDVTFSAKTPPGGEVCQVQNYPCHCGVDHQLQQCKKTLCVK